MRRLEALEYARDVLRTLQRRQQEDPEPYWEGYLGAGAETGETIDDALAVLDQAIKHARRRRYGPRRR